MENSENPAQQLLKLSVSKTKVFAGCKKQFKFSYIQKLPKKDRDYNIVGSFCHRALEIFHSEYIKGCLLPYNISMADAFKKAYSEFKEKMTPEMKADAKEIITNYLQKIYAKQISTSNVLAVEKNFDLPLNEKLIIRGCIDKVSLDDDNVLHVSDYKTTKNVKYLKDDFFQLATYCYVVWLEDPSIEKVRASYILLRHNSELITKEFGIDEIKKIKAKYEDYADQINNETEFPANPTILCNYCDFTEYCEEGQRQTGQSIVPQKFGEIEY